MAKEYIERDAATQVIQETSVFAFTRSGVIKRIKDLPAADVIEVFRPEEDVLAEFEDDYKDFQKIRTRFAEITVGNNVEKPYYSILWWDEERKEFNLGYSSYCLDYVRKWLELVFDVVEEADVVEVVRGHWIRQDDTFTRFQCSACSTVNHHIRWNFCPICGADMRERRDGE